MIRIVFVLAALTPGVSNAADPAPEPVRKWIIATYKTLAEEARENPLTRYEKMWEKVDECVPDRPIEVRAKARVLNWKDGVLRVTIDEPLGWYKPKGLSSVRIDYTRSYYVFVSEKEAEKLRRVEFAIIKAPLKLFVDYSEYQRNHSKTNWVVLTLSTGAGKTAHFASDAIEFEYGGTKYPVVYGK